MEEIYQLTGGKFLDTVVEMSGSIKGLQSACSVIKFARPGGLPTEGFTRMGYTLAGWSTAPDGSENFPGWSLEALKYIYEERNAAANGHEALDTDASAEAAKAGDLACERYVLAKGKLQVEVLCNLDKVAPAGAVLFAAWPRIEGATGLPVRVWAITE